VGQLLGQCERERFVIGILRQNGTKTESKMNYKKRFVFLLITGLFLSTTNAQISGYMGKRFSIGYGGNIGYAMFNRNASGSNVFGSNTDVDYPDRIFSFNYKHQAQMEFIVNSSSVLGIQGSYGITQFKPFHQGEGYYYRKYGYDPNHSQNYYTDEFYDTGDIYAKMKLYTFGVYFKSFTSKIAQVGKYNAFKLSMFWYKPDLSNLKVSPYITPSYWDYKKSAAFFFSRGISRIYFNRMIMDYNFEFGVPFLIPKIMVSYDSNVITSQTEMKSRIEDRMANRLFGNFLFNVNMNVSLLAF
jgi:hypothetical protein